MASPVVGPLVGQSDNGAGVVGTSNSNDGVVGRSTSAFGVFGASVSGVGIRAVSEGDRPALEAQAKGKGIAVSALGDGGAGVFGTSNTDDGVAGRSTSAFGVFGASVSGVGVRAVSEGDRPALEAQAKGKGIAVSAGSNSGDGVFGVSATGVGVHGKGGQLAGLFEGDVKVTGKFHGDVASTGNIRADADVVATGNIHGAVVAAGRIDCPTGTVNCFDVSISNADCAEEFELAGAEAIEPGTLMSFRVDGTLSPSSAAYDNRVAGVISGAGEYKPGIVLDRRQGGNRAPIALLGKVYCKVDAEYAPIEVGDLLTTSATAGYAMKATDSVKAFGSVIGKALRSQSEGRGMIPVLVALQ